MPSRRQGVHPTPWQAASAAHSAHGDSQSAVPATRSAHEGSQSAAPATKSAHEGSQSAAPATKSAHQAPVPSRRQGVHPTPWQAAKCCACHEICTRRFTKYCACHEICTRRFTKCYAICTSSAGAQPTPGRTSDPSASSKRRTQCTWRFTKCCACHDICARRFTKCCACHEIFTSSAGAQPTPGRTSDPLASSKRRAQHGNATGRAPVPSRRQGVHPTPWQARDLRTEVHKVLRLPRNLHIKIHKALRLPRNLQPTPGRTPDPVAGSKVLCLQRNLHMKVHKVLRLPRNLHIKRRCPADARAYIRPLGQQQGAVPVASAAPATKSAHQAPVPSRRQGVHPTPWQAASAAHSTQMLPAAPVPSRRQGVHPTPSPAASATHSAHGDSQSAVPATRSAHEGSQSAAPATKSAHQAPVPSRRRGVHPTPWQAAKRCACHEICTRRFTKYCACHEICT